MRILPISTMYSEARRKALFNESNNDTIFVSQIFKEYADHIKYEELVEELENMVALAV